MTSIDVTICCTYAPDTSANSTPPSLVHYEATLLPTTTCLLFSIELLFPFLLLLFMPDINKYKHVHL